MKWLVIALEFPTGKGEWHGKLRSDTCRKGGKSVRSPRHTTQHKAKEVKNRQDKDIHKELAHHWDAAEHHAADKEWNNYFCHASLPFRSSSFSCLFLPLISYISLTKISHVPAGADFCYVHSNEGLTTHTTQKARGRHEHRNQRHKVTVFAGFLSPCGPGLFSEQVIAESQPLLLAESPKSFLGLKMSIKMY